MADFTQIQNPIKIVKKTANVDYLWGAYDSIEEALNKLGETGEDQIVAGRRFGVNNADGSVTEYKFTKTGDHTSYVDTSIPSNTPNIVVLTKAQYNALTEKEPSTLYLIRKN